MTNTKIKGVIAIALMLAMIFSFTTAMASSHEFNGLRIFDVIATYDGKQLKNVEEIIIDSDTTSREISVTTNSKYVEDSLVIGFKWDVGDWNDIHGQNNMTIKIPDLKVEKEETHMITIEAYINHREDLPENDPERYVGNSNILAIPITYKPIKQEEPEEPVVEEIKISLKPYESYAMASVQINNGEFDHYEYSWTKEGDNSTVEIQVTSGNTFVYPVEPGIYVLEVKGVTKNNVKSDSKKIKVVVEEQVVDDETIEVVLKEYDTYAEAISIIKKGDFDHYEFTWTKKGDQETPKTQTTSGNTFVYPDEVGQYTLEVFGYTKNGVKAGAKLVVNVEEKEESTKPEEKEQPYEGGELDIDPWMKRNPNAEGLLVSLRNRTKDDKANSNFYMLDEEVIYLIDYMNASKEINDEVKIVFNVPLDFTIVNNGKGKVDKDKNTITWTFPYGLAKDAEDTLVVKLKYTALSKKSYKSEMIYPQAVIYKNNKAQDYSAVINCVYKDEDTFFTDEHVPYMYGDKESPTFRPDEGIKRCEGALVLVRIFDEPYLNITEITTKYSDINDTYYVARQAITRATQIGIMSGYPDGTFRPNEKMTRAEFMRVIASYIEETADVKGLDIKDTNSITIYKNTNNPNHWAVPYVTLLARLNMTSVSSKEKDLRIEDYITRAEVAQLCNFFLFRAPAKMSLSTSVGFIDVSRTHKLAEDILEATRETHEYKVTEDGKEKIK